MGAIHMTETPPVNIVAKLLGGLWLLDGVLQLQPLMFGQRFVADVLAPTLAGQPAFMQAIISGGIYLWNTDTILTNSAAALLQTAIGILLFFPLGSKWFRIGAYISIAWGIVVWFCGEGMGLLLTGSASFYTGAPGAVLLYILLAVLLLMPERATARLYAAVAGGVFLFGAALQLQSFFWSADGVQSTAAAAVMESTHALVVFPAYIFDVMGAGPVLANGMLVCVLLVFGLFLIAKPTRVVGVASLAFLFIVWWVGQDFGELSSVPIGVATDPNTAPLMALLLVPLFSGFWRGKASLIARKQLIAVAAGTIGFVALLFVLPYVLPNPPFSDSEQYLEVVGPLKAQDTALQLVQKGKFSDGHMYLHQVGQYALATYGLEGVAYCRPYFDHGCYNGFMMTMTSLNTIDAALHVCAQFGQYALGGCIHGAGHAALKLNEYDIPKALAQCGAWAQELGAKTDILTGCSFGVFMENDEAGVMEAAMDMDETATSSSTNVPQAAWAMRTSDPSFPCDSRLVGQVYRSGCWRMQMVMESNLLPITQSVALCDSLTDESQKAFCFQGVADGYGAYPDISIDTVFAGCSAADTGTWRDTCLLDFVQRAYFNDFGPHLPQQLCPEVHGTAAKAFCTKMLNDGANDFLNTTFTPTLLGA